jgi:ammonium transporter, Amt family
MPGAIDMTRRTTCKEEKMKRFCFIVTLILSLVPSVVFAEGTLNSGDTAWMIMSTALVMMMTPAGLALFYGGMSRNKNFLNTFAMTFAAYCIASVVWVFWGYSLSFGPDIFGVVGGLNLMLLNGIDVNSLSGTIPTYVFVLFQMTFAGITAALVLGSIVDRMKFSAWLVFSVFWITFVYCPIAHWVWGGGWLSKLGALDFAGGTVVHINAGIAGFILSLFLGKRIGYGKEAMFPSSIALTALGSALLWFGWFGFNAGSQLAADGLAGSAFLATNTSAAIGGLAWMFMEWALTNKPTILGLASGVVAGLVGITPAAGFVGLGPSLIIGVVSGILGFICVSKLKHKIGYDDSLDAFGVHGMCGLWGAVATGLFADPSVNKIGTGLFFGNAYQLLVQLISILATVVYTSIGTIAVIYLTRLITGGLRVEVEEEIKGLDSSLHGERAFNFDL